METLSLINSSCLLTLNLHVGSWTWLEKNTSLSDWSYFTYNHEPNFRAPEYCLTTLLSFPHLSLSSITALFLFPLLNCSTSSPLLTLSWWLYLLFYCHIHLPMHLCPYSCLCPLIMVELPKLLTNCVLDHTPTRFPRTLLCNSFSSPRSSISSSMLQHFSQHKTHHYLLPLKKPSLYLTPPFSKLLQRNACTSASNSVLAFSLQPIPINHHSYLCNCHCQSHKWALSC